MGRSYTPKYRVECHDDPFAPVRLSAAHSHAWVVKEKGRPTDANLAKWRRAVYDSMCAGGVNEHVSKARGYIPVISHARIVEQKTGEVVAEFTAPNFEVL